MRDDLEEKIEKKNQQEILEIDHHFKKKNSERKNHSERENLFQIKNHHETKSHLDVHLQTKEKKHLDKNLNQQKLCDMIQSFFQLIKKIHYLKLTAEPLEPLSTQHEMETKEEVPQNCGTINLNMIQVNS